MPSRTENLNIESIEPIPTPDEIKAELPLSEKVESLILGSRRALERILDRRDGRMFVVVGPCSIHDPKAALDYGARLKALADEVSDTLLIVMRAYFEKPRTTTGWKGLINDPHLDGSFDIVTGLRQARKLMIDLSELGLPLGTEALDPISPQYLADLISWSAIGARTTESQTHREMASGLSSPVGFKNATDGSLQVAINALQAVSSQHRFLGIDISGRAAVVWTRGNAYGHIVLRGGTAGPNYEAQTLDACEAALESVDLPANLVVDCSHENSGKDPALQSKVFEYAIEQRCAGRGSLVGLMLESNLNWGSQKVPKDLDLLAYGTSITDACIDWQTTEELIRAGAKALGRRG